MIVTRHAARRFVERIDPSYTEFEAFRILIEMSRRSRPIQERTKKGQEQWVVDDIVFVCKRDPRVKGDGLVAVTVARFETVTIDEREKLEHEIEQLEKVLRAKEIELAQVDETIDYMRKRGWTGAHGRLGTLMSGRPARVKEIAVLRSLLENKTHNLVRDT